jgi:hypothetical protein
MIFMIVLFLFNFPSSCSLFAIGQTRQTLAGKTISLKKERPSLVDPLA